MRTAFIVAFALSAASLSSASVADKPLDVRELMTASQFHQTGLDRLNPEELAAFNAWLAAYSHVPVEAPATATALVGTSAKAVTAAPPAVTVSEAKFGQEMLSRTEQGQPSRIESRILGTFKGWTGDTVFTLENGQVWQQAASGFYETHLKDPAVVIKSLGVGYLLTIPGESETIFVKRVH